MSDESKKTMYRVMYRPTGMVFSGDPPILAGRHGQFESLEAAQEGVSACKRWFNERVMEAAVKNDAGVVTEPEKRIFSNNVVVWIDEWLYEWDDEKERLKRGVLVKSGEQKCAESSGPKESSTKKASGKNPQSTSSTEEESLVSSK